MNSQQRRKARRARERAHEKACLDHIARLEVLEIDCLIGVDRDGRSALLAFLRPTPPPPFPPE